MSQVFVLDMQKQPCNPVHPGRARKLLTEGKAAVFRMQPFTIILKQTVPHPVLQPLRLKLDPGSRVTGIAILNDSTGTVVWAAELHHRGTQIKKALDRRRALRHNRRGRKTRHRPARFNNRRRPAGWLPPSLVSRIANVRTWVARLQRLAPIQALSLEVVKFDTQKLQNPEIAGIEYQQGTLVGYEIREYLLHKWGRRCAYCGRTSGPLQVEHIVPRSRGGTNRVSNLTLACERCNLAKGSRTAVEFGYPQIQSQARPPLKDAAAVTSTRRALYRMLQAIGLPLETGTGGQTNYNRTQHALPKAHWLDAVCVGASTPAALKIAGIQVVAVQATGHGSRQMCRTDKYGFPHSHKARRNVYFGFRTGDLGRAVLLRGRHTGVHVGRVAVRASGSFRVGTIDSISHRHIRRLMHADGYSYELQHADPDLNRTP